MSRPHSHGQQSADLVQLLERANVCKASTLRVTGPGALAALLWLCRHGYDHVGYVRPGVGLPHDDDADALIVVHTLHELDLKRVLGLARQIRPGGVFIFQVRSDERSNALAIEWLLRAGGFSIEQRIDLSRRSLMIARRSALARRQAA